MIPKIESCPNCGASSHIRIKVGRAWKRAWRTRRTIPKICPNCHQEIEYEGRLEYVCLNCGYRSGRESQ